MTCALYRHFDAAGRLLYVGISKSAMLRLAQHATKPWADDICRVQIEKHATRQDALRAERKAIRTERPAYNVAHAVRRIERRKHEGAFADYLRRHGVTQAAMGAQIGMAQPEIAKLLSGVLAPSLRVAILIEQATGGEVSVYSWLPDLTPRGAPMTAGRSRCESAATLSSPSAPRHCLRGSARQHEAPAGASAPASYSLATA